METETTSVLNFEQKAKIKLTKNTRGFGWEISALSDTTQEELDNIRKMITQTNADLSNEFGGEMTA